MWLWIFALLQLLLINKICLNFSSNYKRQNAPFIRECVCVVLQFFKLTFFIWTYFCRLELCEIIPFTKNYFFEICLFRSKCCFGLFSFIWPTFCCFVKPHKCLYNVLLLFLNLLTFCCLFSLVYCVSVYSITYLQFYRCYELYARFTFFSKRYIWIRFLFCFIFMLFTFLFIK